MAYKGFFTPTNPEKWISTTKGLGGGRIQYRSSYERKFMGWADTCPDVLKIASEEVVVPYRSPLDGKIHRYYVDFYIMLQLPNGEIVEKLIEIKPAKETKMPRQKKNQKRYIQECKTYAVNQAKWEAARKVAKKNNWEFVIMTEKELGIRR